MQVTIFFMKTLAHKYQISKHQTLHEILEKNFTTKIKIILLLEHFIEI